MYKRLGRYKKGVTEKVIRARISNGLVFYGIYENSELVATTWLISNFRRFLDEAGCYLDAPDNSMWFRDIYVPNEYRGRNLYSRMKANIVRRFYPDVEMLWSSIKAENNSSLRAGKKLGYEPLTEFRRIHLFNILMFRMPADNLLSHLSLSGYQYPRKLIITGRHYHQYVMENMT